MGTSKQKSDINTLNEVIEDKKIKMTEITTDHQQALKILNHTEELLDLEKSVNKDLENEIDFINTTNIELTKKNDLLLQNIQKITNDLEKQTILTSKHENTIKEQEESLKKELEKNSEFTKKNDLLLQNIQKITNDLEKQTILTSKHENTIKEQEESLKKELEKLQKLEEKKEQELENLKNTLSYRWGARLVRSSKSSSTLATLPYSLYKDYKKFKKYRTSKQKNVEPIISKTVKKTKRISELKNLKVAAIMDEFTYNSFKYECNLLQITPDNWKEELSSFTPDLVFIESAWKGKADLWATKISNCASELVEMIQWCHDNNIDTMFWNKEDPVHFDTFVPVAKMVDHVFTTDIDCVPRYKEKVGHNNVQFLPFAAQPAKHNPIELFDRKDAFNFAGSYYLRYPERQRDFTSLIDAVKKFKPVDIYDRNFDNPHPHYTFPEEYQSMILGKLPFEEIDKAYKGYRFGINMNTIKQSQSMFARRVFELLASNTVVVSNFSRGVRLLFGDLVISSDNQNQLSTMLEKYCTDELSYRKLRLLGLRKVMQEHTYAQRLSFITSKIFETPCENQQQKVVLFTVVNSSSEVSNVIESFKKQTYNNKELYIIKNFKGELAFKEKNIHMFEKEKDALKEIISLDSNNTFFGKLNSKDYYGSNYLTDIILSTSYSDADVFGKDSRYELKSKIELNYDGKQYLKAEGLEVSSSLIKMSKVDESMLKKFIKGDEVISLPNMLSIDEFNYCKNGCDVDEKELEKYVDDLKLEDQGISFENKLSKIADTLPAQAAKTQDDSSLPTVSADELYKLFPTPASTKVKLSFSNNKMQIDTKLGVGKHTYIYAKKQYTREELNLVLNSQFTLVSESTLEDVRTVFEFQDKNGKKISHSMNKAGENHALAIPSECRYIRFGLKLVGNGRVKISKLVLGTHGEVPFAIVGKSKKLVLTKQYPSYDDIYKYGFLHSRVRAYKQEGVLVDIFRINNKPQTPYREFEDIDVATGNNELLEETLKTGQYDHVLVHLIDENMWKVLEKFIDKIKVTVWVHGAEIQVWQRRQYEFERMSKEEVDRQKRLSAKRVKFWQSILKKPHENLNLVFVSEYFMNESLDDLEIQTDRQNYPIIHNLIDTDLFKYHKKDVVDRKKILTIRPYASRKYANDLSVKAVEILSTKEFFNDLEFCFVGDGILFDELTAPLKKFKNVKLEKRFLTHREIIEYHKKYGIFLTPTRMDSQGVSRDEAMSSGLVPVTTNCTAIPEFVDSNCGIVVEPESPQALADAIEYLYKNPNRFLELSKAASERVREQCGFDQTIKNEIELIK